MGKLIAYEQACPLFGSNGVRILVGNLVRGGEGVRGSRWSLLGWAGLENKETT